ncbi:MAG: hypothetical protein IIW13_05905 [Paludibacteraceae bacterium]|nr:hypothetical protein [Paludibacteraceae bacterium]
MINFDLNIIDWNAISAIATTLAFVIAFWSIRVTNTQEKNNREFQLKLMRKEFEQRNLDEFINKIIEIYNGTNPLDVLNYSSKFINNQFTEQDKEAIERNANNDQINCIRLNVLVILMNKAEYAKPLIKKLEDIRETYGVWARNINLIKMSFDNFEKPEHKDFIVKALNGMSNVCIQYNAKYESYIQSVIHSTQNLKEQCFRILECFEAELSMQLQQKRKDFEKQLYEYVKTEQKRINAII